MPLHGTPPSTAAPRPTARWTLPAGHTDAQAAEAHNAAGHHSGTGQPFTPSIVLHLRRSNGLPSHLERLRSRGLLTIPEIAEHLGVSTTTIKAWHQAGLLTSHQANDKNIRLFDPPEPGDPGPKWDRRRVYNNNGVTASDRLG